jgi:hypothetical protein
MGNWTPNKFLYKPELGASGSTEKQTYDSGLDRVDARLGNEVWVGDPAIAAGTTLADAITYCHALAAPCTLVLPAGIHTIAADTAIARTVAIRVMNGAIITIENAKTLTINGSLDAGLYQIFSCIGTGKVLFGWGSVPEVYPEWWGNNTVPGTTDMTAAVQAAVLAYPKVRAQSTTYRLTSAISLTRSVTLSGVPVTPSTQGTNPAIFPGTWFYLNHAGKGFFIHGSGTTMEALATYRDQPIPGSGSFTPNDNDWDFYGHDDVGGTDDLTFRKIHVLNPTRGFRCDGGGRYNFYQITGQPLIEGIVIDNAFDVCRIDQVHFWPFWKIDPTVQKWTTDNLDAIHLFRCDNPHLSNIFAIANRSGLRMSQSAAGGVSRLHCANMDIDGSRYGIWVDNSTVNGCHGQFANITLFGNFYGPIAGSVGVLVQGNYAALDFVNLRADEMNANGIRVEGTNNDVRINQLRMVDYDTSHAGFPGIEAYGTNFVAINPKPSANPAPASPAPLYSTTGLISVDDWRDWLPVVTTQIGAIAALGPVSGKYKIVNNTVYVQASIAITTNGSGSGDVRFTLPVATTSVYSTAGTGREQGLTGKQLQVLVYSGDAAAILNYDNTYPGGDGRVMLVSFQYAI